MKKRITALALLLAMLISLLPTGVVAVEEPAHTHLCNECQDETVTWTAWEDPAALPNVEGHYYLAVDVELSAVATISENVVLCLNGHTVTQSAAEQRLFTVNDGATFTVANCTGTGTLQGRSDVAKAGGIGYVSSGGVLKLYNVTATGATSKGNGGAFFAAAGSASKAGGILEIANSTLSGNTSKDASNGGGAIYAGAYSKVTLSNTTISGNTATKGGAVCVNGNGTVVTVTGGSIKDNTATAEGGAIRTASSSTTTLQAVTVTGNKSPKGSAIYMGGSCKVILDSAVITGNPVTDYGAIAKTNGTLNLNGSTKIWDNKKTDGSQMNLYLSGNNTLAKPALTEGATIGISVAANRESMSITGAVTDNPSGYFTSDNSAYIVTLTEGKLALTDAPTPPPAGQHSHCLEACTSCNHAKVEFQEWTSATELPTDGAYYLANDVALADVWVVEGNITLCLNGHTVTQTKASTRIVNVKGTLNLTDCAGSGKLQGSDNGASNGGIVNVFKGAVINLYAGTLTGGVSTSGGGAVFLQKGTASEKGGKLNMYGGTIAGNTAYDGGAVYVHEYTELNITGGTISQNTATNQGGAIRVAANSDTTIGTAILTDNTAPKGSAVYIGGNGVSVTLDGATVTGNPVTDYGAIAKTNGTLTLKGSTKIWDNKKADGSQMNLYLSGNNTLAKPALTQGAKIGVSVAADRANMAFSVALNEGADPSGYFVSDNEAYSVILAEKKLTLTQALPPAPAHSHCLAGCTDCDHEKLEFQVWTSAASLPEEAGAYVLTTDVTLNGPWAVKKDITLCLNGHTVTQTKAANRVITLSAGTLTLTDCVGTGKLQGRTDVTSVGGIINVYKGTTFNLYAGTLTGAKTTNAGGAVFLQSGTADDKGGAMYMYGGAITGNTASEGGAIYVHDYTALHITGGTITGNEATKQGGAMRINKNTVVTVENITVSDNTAADSGALYLGGSDCAVTLKNVTVTGNISQKNGAVTLGNNTAKLILAGKTQICGNTGANLYLLSGTDKAADLNTLTEGAKIGVTLSPTRILDGDLHFSTQLDAGKDPSGYCVSDDSAYEPGLKNGRVVLKRLPQEGDMVHCLYCCEEACSHEKYYFAKWTDSEKLPAAGCYYLDTDVTLKGALTVSKELHLCLNGHKITQTEGRVFAVNNGGLLTISDCQEKGTVTGGSNTYGGFMNLRRGGRFQLYGGSITGNQSVDTSGGLGGAIYIQGGTAAEPGGIFEMFGGEISGNKAATGGAINAGAGEHPTDNAKVLLYGGSIRGNEAIGSGGAIYVSANTQLGLGDVVIEENLAGKNGGAVSANNAQIALTSATIRDNNAHNNGGAFYLSGADCIMTMTGGTISGNKANNGGGLIMETGSQLTMEDGTVSGNQCVTRGTVLMGEGGGLFVSAKCQFTMNGGGITGNTGKNGGGIAGFRSTVTLNGGTVSGNKAVQDSNKGGGNGGGVSLSGVDATIGKVTIENNKCTKLGGGIYVMTAKEQTSNGEVTAKAKGGNVTIDGAQILNNTATGDTPTKAVGNGGGVAVNGTDSLLTVKSGNIGKNTATNGGGILIQSRAKLLMAGGAVSGNSVKTNGGGIYISTNSSMEMTGGSVTGNSSRSSGAGIFFLRSTGELKGGSVSYNYSNNNGGGVYVSGAKVKLQGASISYNTAKKNGGGVITGVSKDKGVNYYPTLTMTAGSVTGNSAVHGAGILSQSKGGVFNLYGGQITYNKSTGNGAGLYASTDSTFHMYGGTVAYNEGKYGAGIYQTGVTATYTGGKIHDNVASKNGGGMSITAVCTVDMKNVEIYNNISNNGGAMVVQSTGTVLKAEDCKFYGNTAQTTGGAAYLSTNVESHFTNCQFTDNKSEGSAGAVFSAPPSKVYMTGCSFSGNEAAKNGGALQIRGTLYLTDSLVENNRAGENGGGIATGKMGAAGMGIVPGLVAANTQVKNNQAALQGGGLYLIRGSKADLTKVEVTGNTAGAEGGGFYGVDDMNLCDLTVTGNTSGGQGYALYLDGSEYDGHSYFIGMIKLSGNILVEENKNGDLLLGEKTAMVIDHAGLGQDTRVNITLNSGLLTNRVYGAYDYEGGNGVYTITQGDRSLTDPEEAPQEETQPQEEATEETQPTTYPEDKEEGGSLLLTMGIIGGVAVAAILLILLPVISKKKTEQKG